MPLSLDDKKLILAQLFKKYDAVPKLSEQLFSKLFVLIWVFAQIHMSPMRRLIFTLVQRVNMASTHQNSRCQVAMQSSAS